MTEPSCLKVVGLRKNDRGDIETDMREKMDTVEPLDVPREMRKKSFEKASLKD